MLKNENCIPLRINKINIFLCFCFSVAKAKILANNELFFKSGSDINLTCVSLQATQPPSYIYWYKDGYLINYSQRGGINVLTERQTRTSTLVISRAVPPDSGNYTCFPSNTSKYIMFVVKFPQYVRCHYILKPRNRVYSPITT